MQIQLTAYPVLNIGKSVFRDFRKVNPESPSFGRPQQTREIVDEKLYNTIIFPTAFRPLAPGKLVVTGSLSCNILIPETRRSRDRFDDFFGGGTSYRRIGRKLMIEMPAVLVKPLPEVPAEGRFLGLIGEFAGSVKLSQKKVNALEPVSLDLTLQSLGRSSFETLKVPEITVPDCRVYPGEVRYNGSNCVISYALVPLKAGSVDMAESFCFFDPRAGQYKNISIDTVLQVDPPVGKSSAAPSTPALPVGSSNGELAAGNDDQPLPRTTLLYCKKSPESTFSRFYRNNRVVLAVILFLAGPIILLLVELIRKMSNNKLDHAEIRREKAKEIRNK